MLEPSSLNRGYEGSNWEAHLGSTRAQCGELSILDPKGASLGQSGAPLISWTVANKESEERKSADMRKEDSARKKR